MDKYPITDHKVAMPLICRLLRCWANAMYASAFAQKLQTRAFNLSHKISGDVSAQALAGGALLDLKSEGSGG